MKMTQISWQAKRSYNSACNQWPFYNRRLDSVRFPGMLFMPMIWRFVNGAIKNEDDTQ